MDPIAALGATHSAQRAEALQARLGGLPIETLLRQLLCRRAAGNIALVSSFGAESAVLLAMVAGIEPATPVLFIDTGRLFPETLAYRDQLVRELGLGDVRAIGPSPAQLQRLDPDASLAGTDPDACCRLRKVRPLERGLAGFDAWITGRKRYQGGIRTALRLFQPAGERVTVNPLHDWSDADVAAYMRARGLPEHPLTRRGYRSLGCQPCTTPVADHEPVRAGRWRGRAKTECGIHVPAPPPREVDGTGAASDAGWRG